MDINYTEASSLATIDRQIEDGDRFLTPAQYEIIRQVIYHTADFEYYSLLEFNQNPLSSGFKALATGSSIVVDVPEIQVSIVPQLQRTFGNSVYCCSTKGGNKLNKTRAVAGLENLASNYFNSIFAIGQDRSALITLIDLIKTEKINPSLAIATAPGFTDIDIKQYFKTASIPAIYVNSPKGCATVASAIINSLVNLSWRAKNS